MFGRRFTLFTVLGFRVQADPSWLIIAALVTWSLSAGLFPLFYPGLATSTYWFMGIAGAFGLFFSILWHEISHSLVGRRYGMGIAGITLWIFGGIAEMTKDADRPRTEFLMAGAGPLSSFVLAGLFYVFAFAGSLVAVPITVVGVLGYLAWLNVILAIFNLIPAFPLDGGRILRSALWARFGIVTATRVSSAIGNMFGWLLIGLGAFAAIAGNLLGGIWWILIGSFVRFAAKASLRQFMATRLLADAPVAKLMSPNPPSISPELPISRFVEEYVYSRNGNLYPVTRNGSTMGVVDIDSVNRVPRSQWDVRTVGDLTQTLTDEQAIAPDEEATSALERLQRLGRRSLMVTRNGSIEGIVSIDDLERYIRRKAALEEQLGSESRPVTQESREDERSPIR